MKKVPAVLDLLRYRETLIEALAGSPNDGLQEELTIVRWQLNKMLLAIGAPRDAFY